MLLEKERLAEAKPLRERPKLRWNVLLKDLRFFAAVWLGQLMVWRVLRRLRSERAARLERIKLVPDAKHEEDR